MFSKSHASKEFDNYLNKPDNRGVDPNDGDELEKIRLKNENQLAKRTRDHMLSLVNRNSTRRALAFSIAEPTESEKKREKELEAIHKRAKPYKQPEASLINKLINKLRSL